MVIFSISSLSDEIIPLKKPLQTKEEKEHKLLKDALKPLPKPRNEVVVKKEPEVLENKTTKKIDLILPKKKPLIAGTEKQKTLDLKKSKYYSNAKFR